jgi:hypothetical protein
MYVKLKNGLIDKYPYSINQLKQDNKDTSFPTEMSDERLADWDVFPVVPTDYPQVDYKQIIAEDTPINENGVWKQVWNVTDKSVDEISVIQESNKKEAYREESDPLFFKWQRGEATQQEWLDKVNEIKQRWS